FGGRRPDRREAHAHAHLLGVDLDGRAPLALRGLPGAALESAHDHAPGPLVQAAADVLGLVAPDVDPEVGRLAVLPAVGVPDALVDREPEPGHGHHVGGEAQLRVVGQVAGEGHLVVAHLRAPSVVLRRAIVPSLPNIRSKCDSHRTGRSWSSAARGPGTENIGQWPVGSSRSDHWGPASSANQGWPAAIISRTWARGMLQEISALGSWPRAGFSSARGWVQVRTGWATARARMRARSSGPRPSRLAPMPPSRSSHAGMGIRQPSPAWRTRRALSSPPGGGGRSMKAAPSGLGPASRQALWGV